MAPKTKARRQARQGDILFVPVASIPRGAKQVADGVIVRGHATGHTHALRAKDEATLRRVDGGDMHIRVTGKTAHVDHQEHETVTLVTGAWRVVRQREHEPEGARFVND